MEVGWWCGEWDTYADGRAVWVSSLVNGENFPVKPGGKKQGPIQTENQPTKPSR